ncbi:hypothetical protein MMC34_002349 [Xylographa carneopallida]|nr:hypothetical protein [Xylographa carneopallida]
MAEAHNPAGVGSPPAGRLSYFKELDIDGNSDHNNDNAIRPQRRVRFKSKSDVFESSDSDTESAASIGEKVKIGVWVAADDPRMMTNASSMVKNNISQPWSRVFPLTIVFAMLLILLHISPLVGKSGTVAIGVEGGVIRAPRDNALVAANLNKRQNSPTQVCTRWAHQSALVNGTLYIYGGQATQEPQQANNTWNNDFLTVDLTKTWNIGSPTVSGLPQPSGPPAVSLGYLWNSLDSLFLYGGEYSSAPTETPTAPFSLWEYAISSSSWIQHNNPTTSSGTNSDPGGAAVQDVAEGAGITIPELGRGYYFGGHQDPYTTFGWAQWFPRVYIKSMIEFTFPGSTNTAISSMSNGQTAGSDGAWRNITQGGIQASDGFPERADGVLVYVPGYGPEGILLGLAGGTNATFDQMNVIDVYDIASSTWYTQPTNGSSPSYRVDPCAVAFSAADGSSTNVYMYGGQDLIPAGQQVQYDDLWILTIPAFTWIKADTSGQSTPGARAGHTCNAWDAQMVVVGGYVGQNQSCDYPGIYVFDASELKWVNQFTTLTGGDTEDQQESQAKNSTGLTGSYGYQVPAAVQSIIGGQATGGATVTAPAVTATSGPLATGKPIIYTVTASNGATVTETASPQGGGGSSGNGGTTGSSSNAKSGPNIAAIVAGVIAGLLFIVCCYLGFCAWVYRRQLQLYKNHVAMSQRAAVAGPNEKTAFMFGRGSTENSSSRPGKYSTDQSSGPSANRSSALNSSTNESGVPPMPSLGPVGGNSTTNSSTEDLMTGVEPSFVGVLLNPRRSLRVINRD